MAEATKPVLTGGCQCGAVRFAVSAPPNRISICHCRMYPKATGAPFASFADIEQTDFTWTRGKPAAFQSSSMAERDFCAACGTPELPPHRRPEDRDHDGRLRPARSGSADAPVRHQIGSAGWSASPICRARPRCRITRPGKARQHRQPPASGPRLNVAPRGAPVTKMVTNEPHTEFCEYRI